MLALRIFLRTPSVCAARFVRRPNCASTINDQFADFSALNWDGTRGKNLQELNRLGVRSATISVIAHVYKPMMPDDKYEPTGTRAGVTLIPACVDK